MRFFSDKLSLPPNQRIQMDNLFKIFALIFCCFLKLERKLYFWTFGTSDKVIIFLYLQPQRISLGRQEVRTCVRESVDNRVIVRGYQLYQSQTGQCDKTARFTQQISINNVVDKGTLNTNLEPGTHDFFRVILRLSDGLMIRVFPSPPQV